MITRAVSLASPEEPSIVTTDANATGGTARWNSRPMGPEPLPFLLRPGAPLIAFSAASTADTSADGSSGDAAPNDSRVANVSQDSSGLQLPNCWQAASAWVRNSASDTANSGGADPMTRNSSGSRPARNRWCSPGSSLRFARSPVAPNSTITCGSGLTCPCRAEWPAGRAGPACSDRVLTAWPPSAPRARRTPTAWPRGSCR